MDSDREKIFTLPRSLGADEDSQPPESGEAATNTMTTQAESTCATTGGSLPGIAPEKKERAALPFIAIDTETGGTRPGRHALLSIAAVASWDAPAFTAYIVPNVEGYTVEPEAARVNGYTPERWEERGAVSLAIAMAGLCAWLEARFAEQPKAKMLAHNAGFDRIFLDEAAVLTGVRLPIRHAWRCSMDKLGTLMDRGLIPEGKANLARLGELSGFWQSARPELHEADEDARACLHGYQWMLNLEAAHSRRPCANFEVIIWLDAGDPPDDDLTVLVSTAEGVGEGFHEAGVWRWAQGHRITSTVTGWADLPDGFAPPQKGKAVA